MDKYGLRIFDYILFLLSVSFIMLNFDVNAKDDYSFQSFHKNEAIFTELLSIGQVIDDKLYTQSATIKLTPDGIILNLEKFSIPVMSVTLDNQGQYCIQLYQITGDGYWYEPQFDYDWQCRWCKAWNPLTEEWACINCHRAKPVNPKYYKDVRKKIMN